MQSIKSNQWILILRRSNQPAGQLISSASLHEHYQSDDLFTELDCKAIQSLTKRKHHTLPAVSLSLDLSICVQHSETDPKTVLPTIFLGFSSSTSNIGQQQLYMLICVWIISVS